MVKPKMEIDVSQYIHIDKSTMTMDTIVLISLWISLPCQHMGGLEIPLTIWHKTIFCTLSSVSHIVACNCNPPGVYSISDLQTYPHSSENCLKRPHSIYSRLTIKDGAPSDSCWLESP